MRKMLYAVYDLKDSEAVVCIGDAKEISNFLGITEASLLSAITRESKVAYRYIIKRVGREED